MGWYQDVLENDFVGGKVMLKWKTGFTRVVTACLATGFSIKLVATITANLYKFITTMDQSMTIPELRLIRQSHAARTLIFSSCRNYSNLKPFMNRKVTCIYDYCNMMSMLWIDVAYVGGNIKLLAFLLTRIKTFSKVKDLMAEAAMLV